ncbi:MAG: hypothetical protein CFE26_03265 [Verrucomicrobiales bacterium VVV1]|nr:MAG: hypothetical protein CFE26_03265 [Verrucomicrobiales bacterium VVV1]
MDARLRRATALTFTRIKCTMRISIAALAVCLAFPCILEAQDKSQEAIHEIGTLLVIAPNKRTKEQKERIRAIWGSNEQVQVALHGVAVLQTGDSIFDFPGLICSKNIQYDAAKREYSMAADFSASSSDGGKDRWDVHVTFSEDGIVTGTQRLKMNSR